MENNARDLTGTGIGFGGEAVENMVNQIFSNMEEVYHKLRQWFKSTASINCLEQQLGLVCSTKCKTIKSKIMPMISDIRQTNVFSSLFKIL